MHLWSDRIFKTKAKHQKQTREKQMGMVCFRLTSLYCIYPDPIWAHSVVSAFTTNTHLALMVAQLVTKLNMRNSDRSVFFTYWTASYLWRCPFICACPTMKGIWERSIMQRRPLCLSRYTCVRLVSCWCYQTLSISFLFLVSLPPKGGCEWIEVWCPPPIWNLKAHIWFLFPMSSLTFLPGPLASSFHLVIFV